MRELDIEEHAIFAADTDSARKLGERLGTGFQKILSIVFLTGFFAMIYLFFTNPMITDLGEWAKGQLGMLIGILTAAVSQIIVYWFGSSAGSKAKTDIMLKQGS